jgi:hypothetical protein
MTRGEVFRFVLTTVVGVLCSDALLWGTGILLRPVITNQTVLTNTAKLVAVLSMAVVSYLGMRLWVFVHIPHVSKRDNKPMQLHHTMSAQDEALPSRGGAPVERASKPLWTQSLSVVLPAHNEEANIAETVSQAVQTLHQWVQAFEIVVVNDGSTDATGSILESLQQQDAHIRIITHPVNRGYGAALVSGFEAASKELVFFMDSDGQFDIVDIRHFFPYVENYDAVIGYRVKRQDSWMRKLNAWGWKMLVRLILGVQVRDVDCAFKLYHADFLHRHRLETRGAMINAEMLYKLKRDGGMIKEIGVKHLPRRAGRATGANIKVIVCAFRELWIYARRWKREEHRYSHVVE